MRIDIPDIPDKADKPDTNVDLLRQAVPPTKNKETARYAIVGEAPSWMEMKEGMPFVGPAGNQLARIMAAIGMPKHLTYMTNCCKTQLPGNNTSVLWTPKGYRCPEWGQLQRELIQELASFPGKIIILAGATPMRMLLDTPRIDSIDKFRGSIYHAEDFPHLAEALPGKLICLTNHPAKSLANNDPTAFYIIMGDLQKFVQLEENPELLDQPVITHTQPSYTEAMDFLSDVLKRTETSFDIEATPSHVTCFAFTREPNEAMSIPLLNNQGNYWTPQQETDIWLATAKILSSPNVGKIAQNGMFDFMYILRTMGIKTDGFLFDTMIAQHICWTDLPKGLDFLVSVYTHYPYYKDEGKLSHLKLIKDWPSYWLYNARDAAYTHLIYPELQKELTKFGAWDAYNYQMNLHKPLMEMEFNGINFSVKEAQEERLKLNRKASALQKGINKLAKKDLNHNSSKQLISFFYGECNLKPYMNRTTKKPTCDAVALSRIAKNNLSKKGTAKKAGAIARMITRLRKITKLTSTYFDIAYDPDQRIRCTHKICGTSSGRISTEQTFFGTGANLQNQPPAFKRFLVADPDHLLVEIDLAKAEAHVVAYLCQDHNMMEAFEANVDVHTFNAAKIFHIELSEVTKTQRNLGKRVVHASNYGMGPQTFSDNLAKDDWFISPTECKELLNAYQRRFPGLKRWQKEIDDAVYRTRILYNLYGRPKRFLGRLDTATMRSAYSYIPQSTVAEILNRGMIQMYDDLELDASNYQMIATVHDSVLVQLPYTSPDFPARLESYLQQVKPHLSQTFQVKGREFTIGLDAKVGHRWSGDKTQTVELKDFSVSSIENALASLS